jgi:hypothetical protein
VCVGILPDGRILLGALLVMELWVLVVHALLQLVAWLYLCLLAIYLAVKKPRESWFTYHRNLQICVFVFVTISVVIMNLFGHMEAASSGHGHRRSLGGGHSSPNPNATATGSHGHSAVPHSTTGWVLYSLLILQLGLGVARPEKESKHRVTWRLAHRGVAWTTLLLSLYQFASSMFQTSISTGALHTAKLYLICLGSPLILLALGATIFFIHRARND